MKVVKVLSSWKEFVEISQVSWVFLQRRDGQAVAAGVCSLLVSVCGWSSG
jgi:hypothetical protein